MRNMILFTAILYAASLAGAQTPYCALRVQVEGTSGHPIEEPVRIEAEDGRVLQTRTALHGIAEFCDVDVGFKSFEVIAGTDSCGQSVARNLRIDYPRTLIVRLVVNECHGQPIILGACLVLLRSVGPDGPLSGVEAAVEFGGGRTSTRTADAYGRIFLALDLDSSLRITVAPQGYTQESATIHCTHENRTFEKDVVLRRRP